MDEKTRKQREEQIKKLEELQAGIMGMIKDKTQDMGIKGRIRFWFFKNLIKKLTKKSGS